MQALYVAKRPFDPSVGDRWNQYVTWSGLSQLREVVSLDTMLCPTVPEELTTADWDHNVQADYQVFYFRSLDYLLKRVAAEGRLNVLAVLQNPSAADLTAVTLPDFAFAGFDLVDVHGDVSALTNCGGFEGIFGNAELSELGFSPTWAAPRKCRPRCGRSIPRSTTPCATSGPSGGDESPPNPSGPVSSRSRWEVLKAGATGKKNRFPNTQMEDGDVPSTSAGPAISGQLASVHRGGERRRQCLRVPPQCPPRARARAPSPSLRRGPIRQGRARPLDGQWGGIRGWRR